MKKALFLVIASVVFASCGGNAPAEEAAKADSTAVEAAVDSTAVPASTVEVADTAKAVEAVK